MPDPSVPDLTAAAQPWWHPDALARRRPHLAVRSRVRKAVRDFFAEQDFEEVETPALQVSPGLEPHIMAFATEWQGVTPEQGRARLYLHTSPEFAMKKLLAGGVERLYQLCRVFRNGERTRIHQPDFTLLEWYRAEADTETLMADCEALVRRAARAAGRSRFEFDGRSCDPFAPWEILTVQEAFARYAGLDLLATTPDPNAPDGEALATQAARAGYAVHAGDRWEDLFFRVLLEIEPRLGAGRPTILTDYPLSLAALARPKPSDPRLAERFELYACGLELANAFGELVDPVVQRARFEADMDLKARLYGLRYPIDEDFLAALTHGLPPCAGIALGFDRLVMLCSGAERIEDVLWAPVVTPDG